MITQKILASGKFLPEDLIVSVGGSNRKIDPKIESQLDGLWEIELKNANEKGLNCYNGLCYRLNSLNLDDEKLILDFGTIDFKTWICLRAAPGYFDLPEEYFQKGCHTLATVRTSDGKYLMVELSGKSMNTNSVDFLGGAMETDVPMKAGEDIFQSFFKELGEESLIEKEDIENAYLKMVYLNPKTNVGFYFEVTLRISSDELTERLAGKSKDIDIESLKVFSRDEYLETLRNHNVNKQFISTVVEI